MHNIRFRTVSPQTEMFYSDHMNQVKRGLRPRSPRPSGPPVRNGRAASLGGSLRFYSPHGLSIPILFPAFVIQQNGGQADASPPFKMMEHRSLSPVRDSGRVKGTD